MTNKNKHKGDRAERAVRDWALKRYPGSFRTRAGFHEDVGDVILSHSAGAVVLQVKDVANPNWRGWFSQLTDQIATAIKEFHGTVPVVGGLIVHKLRGKGDAGAWRAVMTLQGFADTLDRAYAAGYEQGRKDATNV